MCYIFYLANPTERNDMKSSYTRTPRTLGECTFTELNACEARPSNSDAIVVWASVIAFVVLVGLMAFGAVK